MTPDIIFGDCIEIMRTMQDKSYSLVMTDPPYNVGLNYGASTDDNQAHEIYLQWSKAWFNEAQRVAKSLIFTPGKINEEMWLREIEYPKGMAILHTPNQNSGSCLGGFSHYEHALVYGKVALKKDHFSSVIKHQRTAEGHPCPKQLETIKEILASCRPKPKKVLDIFAGSGTTLRACKELDIKCTGIEINQDYEGIINRRMLANVRSLETYCTDGKKCVVCGNTVTATRSDSMFCCNACRQKHYRLKNKSVTVTNIAPVTMCNAISSGVTS